MKKCINHCVNKFMCVAILLAIFSETGVRAQQLTPKYPDNVYENIHCSVEPVGNPWSIKESLVVEGSFCSTQPVYAGDLDGDGEVEMVTALLDPLTIVVLSSDGGIKYRFVTPSRQLESLPVQAIGRVKWSENEYKTIVICVSTGNMPYLSTYNPGKLWALEVSANGLTPLWVSDYDYADSVYQFHFVATSLADLDGDGYSELIAGNRVFAAETGKLLCKGSDSDEGLNYNDQAPDCYTIQTAVGDVLGNGRQQVCAGNKIYSVNIANRNGMAGNSMTATTFTPILYDNTNMVNLGLTDGCTQIADFDLDGYPDILVSTTYINSVPYDRPDASNCGYFYIWSPHKGKVLASYKMPYLYKKGIPMIGNINDTPYPEIVFISGARYGATSAYDYMTAFEYNPSSAQLGIFWQWPFMYGDASYLDPSANTTMSLFDFNQDDIMEIVYRDENALHIINGSLIHHETGNSLTLPYNMATYRCYSLSYTEYPTVADIDGDGQAEILTVGSTQSSVTAIGELRIYKAGDGAFWAPARKVWNQYAYNALNVNKDLTIPKHPFSVAMVFRGADKQFGTGDDLRPFNSFLQQATLFDTLGLERWLTPDVTIISCNSTYDAATDRMTLNPVIRNIGDEPFAPPIRIAAYKDSIAAANLVTVETWHDTSLQLAESVTGQVIINGYRSLGIRNLILRVNDDGSPHIISLECDTLNNVFEHAALLFMANDDIVGDAVACGETLTVDVLGNDELGGCGSPALAIKRQGKLGTAVISGSMLQYVATAVSDAPDTVVYIITCNSMTDSAKVIIPTVYAGYFVDDVWFFGRSTNGRSPGIAFTKDANGAYFVHDSSGVALTNVRANSLVVTSPYEAERVLFYTSGNQLYNAANEPMFNGIFEGNGEVADGLAACYMGDNKYLMFSVTAPYNQAVPRALKAYIIDMNGDHGRGMRTAWSATIESEHDHLSESIELIPRQGASDQYWLIYAHGLTSSFSTYYNSNCIYSRLVDVSDPSNPVISAFRDSVVYNDNNMIVTRQLKASPSGKRIVVIDNHTGQLYDFDPKTGRFSNPRAFDANASDYLIYSLSAEFSPNEKYLYITNPNNDQSGAKLKRFDISGAIPIYKDQINYWTTKFQNNGGGLKLAPDGKIYVIQANTDKVGVISHPDADLPLANNYISDGLTLSVTGGVYNFFPTGLTRPAIMPCNNNHAPVAVEDVATVGCLMSDTMKINVLSNDYDLDGDSLFLISAQFTDLNDTAYASVSIDAATGLVKFIFKHGYTPSSPKTFLIRYIIKDNGNPASLFGEGLLTINAQADGFDATYDLSQSSAIRNGNAVTVNVAVVNQGNSAYGDEIYITLYKDSVSLSSKIGSYRFNRTVQPGNTTDLHITIADVRPCLPFANIVVRINDNGSDFPYSDECNINNNEFMLTNPALPMMMKKRATLNYGAPYSFVCNGSYSNPVSILYSDTVRYEIIGYNVNTVADKGDVIISDTLPTYMAYTGHSSALAPSVTQLKNLSTEREVLTWIIPDVPKLSPVTVWYNATPQEGSVASQPLFINKAWVKSVVGNDTVSVQTDSATYHQGAGVATVFFVTSKGGTIFNAVPQAVDFNTNARPGVLIAPDEGYKFAGWSHEAYISMRGTEIPADSGIMNYETITIYGNVELCAEFEPVSSDDPTSNETVDGENSQPAIPAIWTSGSFLYVKTGTSAIVRIYTASGVLYRQQTIMSQGITQIKLQRGVYIVTLNNGIGKKIVIK